MPMYSISPNSWRSCKISAVTVGRLPLTLEVLSMVSLEIVSPLPS